jgi:hypothetical protein
VLTSVEKTDEGHEVEVAERAAAEIQKLARQVGAQRIVIHSFAHLFAQLSSPAAVETMKQTEAALRTAGMEVVRTPFEWFNILEIRAKSHPSPASSHRGMPVGAASAPGEPGRTHGGNSQGYTGYT